MSYNALSDVLSCVLVLKVLTVEFHQNILKNNSQAWQAYYVCILECRQDIDMWMAGECSDIALWVEDPG